MRRVYVVLFVFIIILPAILLLAEPPGDDGNYIIPDDAITNDNTTFIDANKLLMFNNNQGQFGYDITAFFDKNDGLYFPYVDTTRIRDGLLNRTCLYADGVILGGMVNGSIRIALAAFSAEYVPGPMANGTYQDDNPAFKVYKLYRDSLTSNPNDDYLNWPVDQGAPVTNFGTPDMIGDQMLWTVFNDANPYQHNASSHGGATQPLGVEIQQTVWAADESGDISIPIDLDIQADHVMGSSDGHVHVEIVDTSQLTGHDYQVSFESHSELGSTWDLIDLTTGLTVLDNQTNQNGDGQYEVVDGMKVIVFGEHLGVKTGDQYVNPGDTSKWGWYIPNGAIRFTWAQADGFEWEGFRGAIGWGGPGDTHGFGLYDPVPALELPQVLLKLATVTNEGVFDPNDENVSYAYRYLRLPGPPAIPEFEPCIVDPDPPDGSYGFQDFEKSVPLSAWDVSTDPPRRLVVGFLENNRLLATLDCNWFPPTSAELSDWETTMTAGIGPQEWLWIYNDDYSETPNPAYQLNAIEDQMPIMYWLTVARRGSEAPFSPGYTGEDQFMIIPQNQYVNTPEDIFTFTATTPEMLLSGEEGLSIYLKYKLYNKGGNTIEDFYFSLWSDPDLGSAGDDLVGCDTLNNIGYCYNDGADDDYGNKAPAVGFKILKGMIVPSPGDTADFDGTPMPGYKNLGMTSFNKYINGTDPDIPWQMYGYMQGFDAVEQCTNCPYIDPNTGFSTKFPYSGDPVLGTGWVDNNQADRRLMLNCGPVTLNPGDSQYVLIKLGIGQGIDQLNSITKLIEVLNNVSEVDTSMVARLYPEPQFVFFADAVEPVMDTIVFGHAGGAPLDEIDNSSIMINGLVSPISAEIQESHPDFAGEVMQIVFPATNFLANYGLLWDMAEYDYTVGGDFIGKGPFEITSTVTIIGHRSGDVNDDGRCDLLDITYLINYIYKGGPLPAPYMESADVNGSRSINLMDVTYMASYLYKNGPGPNCPKENIW